MRSGLQIHQKIDHFKTYHRGRGETIKFSQILKPPTPSTKSDFKTHSFRCLLLVRKNILWNVKAHSFQFSIENEFWSRSRDHVKWCARFVPEKAWCGKKISIVFFWRFVHGLVTLEGRTTHNCSGFCVRHLVLTSPSPSRGMVWPSPGLPWAQELLWSPTYQVSEPHRGCLESWFHGRNTFRHVWLSPMYFTDIGNLTDRTCLTCYVVGRERWDKIPSFPFLFWVLVPASKIVSTMFGAPDQENLI